MTKNELKNQQKVANKYFKDLLRSKENSAKKFAAQAATEETIYFHAKSIERLLNKEMPQGVKVIVSMSVEDAVGKEIFSEKHTPKKGIGNALEIACAMLIDNLRDIKEDQQLEKKG